MRLVRNTTLDEASDRLAGTITGLKKLGHHPFSTEYLAWADDCETELRAVFTEPDIAQLLHTDRYWYLYRHEESDDKWVNTNMPTPDPTGQETTAQLARLTALAAQIDAMGRLARQPGRPLVYDTNSLMHYQPPDLIDWNKLPRSAQAVRLIVPLVVIDELDRKKYAGTAKMSERATAALRALDRMLDGTTPGSPVPVPGRTGVSIEVLLDEEGHARASSADDEIIERAALLSQITRTATAVITADTGMRMRAQAAGLDTLKLDGYGKDQP